MRGRVWREGGVKEGKYVSVDFQTSYPGMKSGNETIRTLGSH